MITKKYVVIYSEPDDYGYEYLGTVTTKSLAMQLIKNDIEANEEDEREEDDYDILPEKTVTKADLALDAL